MTTSVDEELYYKDQFKRQLETNRLLVTKIEENIRQLNSLWYLGIYMSLVATVILFRTFYF